jgi:Transposase
MMEMWCGIDWAERHHDVAIVDDTGTLRARARITDDAAGLTELLEVPAVHGRDCDSPILVAIETAKGLLVANLRAAEMTVYAMNPLSAGGGSFCGGRALPDAGSSASSGTIGPAFWRCAMSALLVGYARCSTDQQDLTAHATPCLVWRRGRSDLRRPRPHWHQPRAFRAT